MTKKGKRRYANRYAESEPVSDLPYDRDASWKGISPWETLEETTPVMLLKKLASRGSLTTKEVDAAGIPRRHLNELAKHGLVMRVGRGAYADRHTRTHFQLAAAVSKALAQSTICLLSAAHIQGLLLSPPEEVWVTLIPGTRPPKLEVPIRHVYMRPHLLEGNTHVIYTLGRLRKRLFEVTVTTLEKTVIDLLKHASKVEERQVREILTRYLERRPNRNELYSVAEEQRGTAALQRWLARR